MTGHCHNIMLFHVNSILVYLQCLGLHKSHYVHESQEQKAFYKNYIKSFILISVILTSHMRSQNYTTAKFMHRYYLKKVPKSSGNFFTLSSSVHSSITRNSSKLYQYFIPQFSTNLLQRCIKFKGAKIWNNIPDDLKQNTGLRLHPCYLLQTIWLLLWQKSLIPFPVSLLFSRLEYKEDKDKWFLWRFITAKFS